MPNFSKIIKIQKKEKPMGRLDFKEDADMKFLVNSNQSSFTKLNKNPYDF